MLVLLKHDELLVLQVTISESGIEASGVGHVTVLKYKWWTDRWLKKLNKINGANIVSKLQRHLQRNG